MKMRRISWATIGLFLLLTALSSVTSNAQASGSTVAALASNGGQQQNWEWIAVVLCGMLCCGVIVVAGGVLLLKSSGGDQKKKAARQTAEEEEAQAQAQQAFKSTLKPDKTAKVPDGLSLVMERGPTPGKVYPLRKHEIAFGRGLASEVQIDDESISGRHARMVYRGDSFVVEDTGSANGTFVNSNQVSAPCPVNHGDKITLGSDISFRFQDEAALAPPPTPDAPQDESSESGGDSDEGEGTGFIATITSD